MTWDKPGAGASMLASMTPQEAIASGLPKPSQCDIVVVVPWSHMGTSLPVEYRKADGSGYRSGTEWEFLDALAANRLTARPEIVVYRRTERCAQYPDDPEFEGKLRQYESVKEFFSEFKDAGGAIRLGVNDYSSPADFREALSYDLRQSSAGCSSAQHGPRSPDPREGLSASSFSGVPTGRPGSIPRRRVQALCLVDLSTPPPRRVPSSTALSRRISTH